METLFTILSFYLYGMWFYAVWCILVYKHITWGNPYRSWSKSAQRIFTRSFMKGALKACVTWPYRVIRVILNYTVWRNKSTGTKGAKR